MADLSDVEIALVSQITDALYPNGSSFPSVINSICRVYRGWPSPANLNTDLSTGIVNVTVVPATTSDEVLAPYFDRYYAGYAPVGLIATVKGNDITFSGLVASNQLLGILVDGQPYCYRINIDDTLEIIAAKLGAMVSTDRIAFVSASTLTIPGTVSLAARIVADAAVSRGLRRQSREIQVICWCPSPAVRDLVCANIDLALTNSPSIDLVDLTKAYMRYVATHIHDQSQSALLYRRDLCYKCEYTLISTVSTPVMLFGSLSDNDIRTYT